MKHLVLFLTFAALTFVGCKKDDSQYTLDKSSLTLKVGQEHTFIMSKGGKDYNPNLFSWYSSDTEVGGVNAGGFFRAGKRGHTTIKADYVVKSTNERYSATCEVTVTN